MPSLLRRILFVKVPAASRAAFARDLPAIGSRSVLVVLSLSLGAQLVQSLGGGVLHVAALRTAIGVGLLLSLLYVRVGRGRSPLTMLFLPEAAAMVLLMAVGFVAPGGGIAPATALTALALAAVSVAALGIPFLSTIYGLVYPPDVRPHLVAYGRMVHGIAAILTGWFLGQLFAADPWRLRVVFPIAGVVGLSLLWRFFRMPVPAARTPQPLDPPSALAILKRDRNFRRFQFFQFLLGFANLSAMPVIDIYVRKELGLGIDRAVLVVSHGVVMQAVILLTVRYQGGLFRRLGVVRHRVLTSVLLGLALVVWAFADNIWLAAVAALLGGLGMAGGQIIWMIGSLYFARPEEHSAYSAIHTFLTGVRALFAPALGVALTSSEWLGGSYRMFFLGAAGLVFISVIGHASTVDVPAEAAGP